MEERKIKEIEYYDQKAEGNRTSIFDADEVIDFEGFRSLRLASFRHCYELLKQLCPAKTVLDWGCGNGAHTVSIAKMGAQKIIGIDLSDESLKIARQRSEAAGFGNKVEFLKMDCEKTGFLDNEFGVIFDGGTFSSIDIEKAFPELARILKSGGALIGIETFGHNPAANLKRALNVRLGKRTAWAASHIFNEAGINLARKYFGKVEIQYFHLFSWVLFGVAGTALGKWMLDLVEPADRLLLKLPFLKKYAFKVVFKFSEPLK